MGIFSSNRSESFLFLLPVISIFSLVFLVHLLGLGFSLYNLDYLVVTYPLILVLIVKGAQKMKLLGTLVIIALLVGSVLSWAPLFAKEKTYSNIMDGVYREDPNATVIFYPGYYIIYTQLYYNLKKTNGSYGWFSNEDYKNFINNTDEVWLIFTKLGKPEYGAGVENLLGDGKYLVSKRYSQGIIEVFRIQKQ